MTKKEILKYLKNTLNHYNKMDEEDDLPLADGDLYTYLKEDVEKLIELIEDKATTRKYYHYIIEGHGDTILSGLQYNFNNLTERLTIKDEYGYSWKDTIYEYYKSPEDRQEIDKALEEFREYVNLNKYKPKNFKCKWLKKNKDDYFSIKVEICNEYVKGED